MGIRLFYKDVTAMDPVLIVGAGPTGLVLALWLTHLGVPVRIIDKSAGPGETSRAMGVQAHTLEYYQQIGIAKDVIAGGIIIKDMCFFSHRQQIATAHVGEMGVGLSPFPYMLSYPQDDHEKLLITYLAKLGVSVERNTELIGMQQDDHSVQATLQSNNKTETVKILYLCGCDGARSFVRTTLNLGFPGGTYSQIFYVADIVASGEVQQGKMQMCLSREDFTLIIPVRSSGSYRLIGIVPSDNKTINQIEFKDVEASVHRNATIEIKKLNWFSTYHVHHRVAEHFQVGRIFLLGDAGHIHSPAGGQGMNTGISDAINLAWKLAAVLQNRSKPDLLESYEIERIIFARKLVSTTDKVFQLMTNKGVFGFLWRSIFLPFVAPIALKFKATGRTLFKLISQIEINYRKSLLSQGQVGKLKGGDRLPWVAFEGVDNFAPLQSIDWQVHVYGTIQSEFKYSLAAAKMPLHEFIWNENFQLKGLKRDAVYLIRPDGYIGLAQEKQDAVALQTYLTEFGIIVR
jgi:2-polyprenyl-6-methoxyphenol hydroxylase-like FAD-dependent oxidoreductase